MFKQGVWYDTQQHQLSDLIVPRQDFLPLLLSTIETNIRIITVYLSTQKSIAASSFDTVSALVSSQWYGSWHPTPGLSYPQVSHYIWHAGLSTTDSYAVRDLNAIEDSKRMDRGSGRELLKVLSYMRRT